MPLFIFCNWGLLLRCICSTSRLFIFVLTGDLRGLVLLFTEGFYVDLRPEFLVYM